MEQLLPRQPPELDLTVRLPSTDVWRLLEPLASAAAGPASAIAFGKAVLDMLFAFDADGWVVQCLHLTNGQPIIEKDVKGIFRRQGQMFSAPWRPVTQSGRP